MREIRRDIGLFLLPALAYNLYFIFLMEHADTGYLIYLDILLGVCFAFYLTFRVRRVIKYRKKKEEYLKYDRLIAGEMEEFENIDIAIHDQQIMAQQLEDQMELRSDLQDYITRWCHEVKIPLSSALLVNERIKDPEIRQSMKEPLEKIRHLMNSALAGCKVQSQIFDLQMRPVRLDECVRESIHNQQFFLIQNHFRLNIRVGNQTVYTDKEWMIYVLDQLITNAVKYAQDQPKLSVWTEEEGEDVRLIVKDYGEGILPEDLKRIYEKGFTGSSHRNGQYKSTGMGLYLAAQILKRLEHSIEAESCPGEYTRFTITFRDNRRFFNL